MALQTIPLDCGHDRVLTPSLARVILSRRQEAYCPNCRTWELPKEEAP